MGQVVQYNWANKVLLLPVFNWHQTYWMQKGSLDVDYAKKVLTLFCGHFILNEFIGMEQVLRCKNFSYFLFSSLPKNTNITQKYSLRD